MFNRRWTFAAADSTRARVLYFAGLGKVEAYLVAIPPVTVATFVANRLWTFGRRS